MSAEELAWHIYTETIPGAMSLLPSKMDSPQARAMMLAIAFQESDFKHRFQVPVAHAHGLWQFEKEGGVKEVLSHPVTMPVVLPICDLLLYAPTSIAVWNAIPYDNELAAIFARCLLYIDPRTMPFHDQPEKGWLIYKARWRPGKPHPEKWPSSFEQAWDIVNADR